MQHVLSYINSVSSLTKGWYWQIWSYNKVSNLIIPLFNTTGPIAGLWIIHTWEDGLFFSCCMWLMLSQSDRFWSAHFMMNCVAFSSTLLHGKNLCHNHEGWEKVCQIYCLLSWCGTVSNSDQACGIFTRPKLSILCHVWLIKYWEAPPLIWIRAIRHPKHAGYWMLRAFCWDLTPFIQQIPFQINKILRRLLILLTPSPILKGFYEFQVGEFADCPILVMPWCRRTGGEIRKSSIWWKPVLAFAPFFTIFKNLA